MPFFATSNATTFLRMFLHDFLDSNKLCVGNLLLDNVAQMFFIVANRDWEVRNDNGDAFHINLCGKPEKCSKDVYICKKDKKGIHESSYSAKPRTSALKTHMGKDNVAFSTNFTGEGCRGSVKYTSLILFYCDKILVRTL